MALLIDVLCLNFVAKETQLENTRRVVWTDSQSVLNWLTSKKHLSVFLQNRITEITSEKDIEI